MRSKWNSINVKLEALRYKTRATFQKGSPGAKKAAIRLGIYEEVCSHMPIRVDISGLNSVHFKWSYEALKKEALRHKTKNEFQNNNGSAYNAAFKRGILEEICSHMPPYHRKGNTNPNFVWTTEMLQEEALKYKNKPEFRKNSRGAFEACKRRRVLEKVCFHMEKLQKRWTEQELIEEAQKYEYRSEFELNNLAAYESARRRKLLNRICKHMKRPYISPQEKELGGRIKLVFPKIKTLKDTKVKIPGKPHIHGFDIDIFALELNKGIEFDGTYTHSFEGLKRGRMHWPEEDIENYHRLKDSWFASKGIQILHITQVEWDLDKEACIKRCLDFLKSNS